MKISNSISSKKLGTFGGVFTPSLLTILGVIMYLRFGWVVGNVGLIGTLAIVTLSTSITFLTSLSIAAIATNAPVKAGGAYYMISRSLGVEIGGAVGIPLFLAQAFSVALYIIGFSESLVAVFPALNMKFIGVGTTLLLGALALFSTKAAIKAQYVILGIIFVSLLSLFFGSPVDTVETHVWSIQSENKEGFWKVFAVFFPAVTGIMAGVNLSGDLKDPAKSIPKGTFFAIGVGYLIYMALPIFLAYSASSEMLIADSMIMRKIAFWGDAILLGIWGATLSSAVGSLLGAPRILQALAADHVLPKKLSFLERESGPERIPRAGTILTIAIALVSVYFGDLNILAPILTMFFLTTYGVLNITAGVERFLRNPSFRPKFKVHWGFSVAGAIGCAMVMFLINAQATLLAFVFIVSIFIWLKRKGFKSAMGGVRKGVLLSIIRFATLRLENNDTHAKSWRPNILVFSGAPTKRWHLIDFANALTQRKALFTVATILSEEKITEEKALDYEAHISEYLSTKKISALVRVMRSSSIYTGAKQLVSAYGLGPLVPNTVILGDTDNQKHYDKYAQMIEHIYHSKRNVIIVQDDEHKNFQDHTKIDIWWGGLKGNGALMMILGYLLKSGRVWSGVQVCIKMVVPTEEAAESARINLSKKLAVMRVDFTTEILVSKDKNFWELIKTESKKCSLTMIGLAPPNGDFSSYYRSLKENTKDLSSKVFVLASQDMEFKDVLS